ncbi:hypothetical protein IF2G_07485 [Cordyceps javanica]|nr:hypothetical protein IF2G_07485 [Cordyceps javanica]
MKFASRIENKRGAAFELYQSGFRGTNGSDRNVRLFGKLWVHLLQFGYPDERHGVSGEQGNKPAMKIEQDQIKG